MLKRILTPLTDPVYVVLRIVVGLMLAFHGVQKLFGVLSDFQPPVGTQMWFGGVIELTTGCAMAAGAFTTWAAFLASGTMAVAYLQFHWKFETGAQLLPTINKGELALTYSLVFLYVACHGSGLFSVDRWREKRSG